MKNSKNCLFYFTRVAFVILIAFFLSYAVRLGARVLIKFSGASNPIVQAVFFDRPDLSGKEVGTGVKVNFAEQYPFGESYEEIKQRTIAANIQAENIPNAVEEENKESVQREEFAGSLTAENVQKAEKNSKLFAQINKIDEKCDKFTGKIAGIRNKLETWLSENIVCRYFFLEKANYGEKIMKWNLNADLYNPVVKLNNGYFSLLQKRLNTAELRKSIVRFSDFLQSENIPFVYIQAPYKISPLDTVYAGVRDFSNQNSDEVLSYLQKNGVTTFDLRQKLTEENRNFPEMFYVTDHHWKAETGLWATQQIVKEINRQTSLFIDDSIYNPENYDYKVYKNALLGSYGKKLTVAKTPADDFTLITPKKHYDIHFEAYDKENQLANNDGDFLAMIDVPTLESKQLYFSSPYHAYGYGSCNNFVTNNSAANNYRILLIGDSFSNVFAPFLALGIKQLDRLDLRYFNGSVETLVKQVEKYDLCIVMYNPDQYAQTPGFVTHEELFDFR